jgi:hypothetical protein
MNLAESPRRSSRDEVGSAFRVRRRGVLPSRVPLSVIMKTRILSVAAAVACLMTATSCHKASAPTSPSSPGALSAIGVKVDYPPSWSIQSSSDSAEFNISNVARLSEISQQQLAAESLFHLRLLRGMGSSGQPMDQWFAGNYPGASNQILAMTSATVGGHPAVRIETVEIGRTVYFFVAAGGDVLEVSYPLYQPSMQAQYESMLASLQFSQ